MKNDFKNEFLILKYMILIIYTHFTVSKLEFNTDFLSHCYHTTLCFLRIQSNRSPSGHFEAVSAIFSSEARLLLILLTSKCLKVEKTLFKTRIEPRICSVQTQSDKHRTTRPQRIN